MDVKDMHYDFKKKLNKVDSNRYKNLLIPEIDWVLNEAQLIFIENISHPRKQQSQLFITGFEKNQRNIDDIRTLVVDNTTNVSNSSSIKVVNNTIKLPDDYLHFIRAKVSMSKGKCNNVIGDIFIEQHDDLFENSSFDNTSFEWREVNGVFSSEGIELSTEDGITFNNAYLTYIRKPKYIHNAEDFSNGMYRLPNGKELTGKQNCELPDNVHRDIVDLAVLITINDLEESSIQSKANKLNLTNLI